jgi:hypothetical protein
MFAFPLPGTTIIIAVGSLPTGTSTIPLSLFPSKTNVNESDFTFSCPCKAMEKLSNKKTMDLFIVRNVLM